MTDSQRTVLFIGLVFVSSIYSHFATEESNDLVQTKVNLRARRSTKVFEDNSTYICDTDILPQPTFEYPAIFFAGINYNACVKDGVYMRLRANTYAKWGENSGGEIRTRLFKWSSMLLLDGLNVTFRACCPSGNEFVRSVVGWKDTPNMNLSVFYHPDLSGTSGIWYKKWLHWVMSFDVRVSVPTTLLPAACGDCYFGQCGRTGKCECIAGYHGTQCELRSSSPVYPTQEKPLILFNETFYRGAYVRASPDEFVKFASNLRAKRVVIYKSMRVLFDRIVTFSRNILFTSELTAGKDIDDIPEFMLSNSAVADPLWYNYDRSIDLTFHVKVSGNSACDSCSDIGGCCYTGACVCLPGYSGPNCDIVS